MPRLSEAPAKKSTARRKPPGAAEAPDAAEAVEIGAETPLPEPAAPKQERLITVGLEDVSEKLNALWYGPGGTGKTTDVTFMANEGQVLFINAEAGIKKRPLQAMGVMVENIQLFPAPNSGQSLSFDSLEQIYWQMKADLEDNPDSWAGTIWDSLTEIHKALLDQVVAYQVQKAVRAGRDRDRFFIDRADYGTMTEQVRLLIRRFRDLPCHFAATALERRDQDPDGNVRYGPAVTPALQSDLNLFVDVVCHTSVEEVGDGDEFRGLFRKTGKFEAKDRFNVLPRRLVDPTFNRVVAYVNGEMEEKDDPVMIESLERAKEVAEEASASAAAKS